MNAIVRRLQADGCFRRPPGVLSRLTKAELGEIRRSVFAENPHLAHDFSALRRLAIARMLALAGYLLRKRDA